MRRSNSFFPTCWPAFVVAGLVVLSGLLVFLADSHLHRVVYNTVHAEAERRAASWVEAMQNSVPEIERLFRGDTLDADELSRVSNVITGGHVFGFKVFNAKGHTIASFFPDRRTFMDDQTVNEKALGVYRTGKFNVSLHHGTAENRRPDTYMEVYLPATGSHGRPIGVLEAYVDVTALSEHLENQFHDMALLILVGAAAMFLLPSVLLVKRSIDMRRRDRALLQLSERDGLTNVMNRRTFTNRAAKVFTTRPDTGRGHGFLFVDMDRFKLANDTHGHEFGDALLIHIAGILESCARPNDFIGRFGGDEFAVVLPNISIELLREIGHGILADAKRPFTYNGATFLPGLSIGLYHSGGSEAFDAALNAADLAVYRAKASGRGCVVEYSPALDEIARRRKHVEARLRSALVGNEFDIAYQPIVEASTGRIAHFEALLRLSDTDGTPIPPSEFVPVAEDAGLISRIGSLILRRAIATAQTWPDHVGLAVNLSALEFSTPGLAGRVKTCLDETGFDPARLELEVTESLLLEEESLASKELAGLKAMGVSLALDDFGTGYSSLGYLWKYSFDKLKIDRVFLEGYAYHREKYHAILETIVMLGHQLDMKVVVEGVETDEQRQLTTSLGVDLLQGFRIGRPMGPERALDRLAEDADAGDPLRTTA